MKKKLFLGLLAAAAVSFTACQKDEVISEMPQDEAISFNTYLGRGAQTKGSVIETAGLQTAGFGVYAYYTGQNDITNTKFSTAPDFMNNVKVSYSGTAWGYTDTKYWPNTEGDKISFYAYGPYDENTTNAISVEATNTAPTLTYTVDGDVTKHMDVLFTPAQENQTKENGSVDMTFYHALSRIGFTVQASGTYSEVITLKSVKLTGKFYESGTMNLANATASSTTTEVEGVSVTTHTINPGWNATVPSEAREFIITEDVTALTGEATAVGTNADYIMIIPQTFEGSNKIKITATYEVDGISNTVYKETEFTFEAGKAYKFAIKIGLNEVIFSANVIAWDENHDAFNPGTDVTIQ